MACTRIRLLAGVTLAASLSLVTECWSAPAPAALRGKSVTVSWSEERSQRNVGEADWRAVTIRHEFRVYVSSAGRIFSRLTNANRRGSGSDDQISGEGGATRVAEFADQAMTIMMARSKGGARRLTVDFGEGFSNCRADVIRAKQVGASTIVSRSIITGRMVEIRSVTVSGATCAVQAGNVFGGE